MGFCNYLGEVQDSGAGAVRELYGKQLEGKITVEIRAERAADCEAGLRDGDGGAAGEAAGRHSTRGAALGGADLGESHGNVFAAGKLAVPGGISRRRAGRTARDFWTLR